MAFLSSFPVVELLQKGRRQSPLTDFKDLIRLSQYDEVHVCIQILPEVEGLQLSSATLVGGANKVDNDKMSIDKALSASEETRTEDSDSDERGSHDVDSGENHEELWDGSSGTHQKVKKGTTIPLQSRATGAIQGRQELSLQLQVPPLQPQPPLFQHQPPPFPPQVPPGSLGGQWQWMQPQWGQSQGMQAQSWGMSGQGPLLYQPPWTPSGAPEVLIRPQLTPESACRASRRQKRKEYDNKSIGRSAAGKKPSQVTVTPTGDIDGGCAGKNAWDESVRTFVPLILDMSMVEWDNHKPETLTKLQEALDNEFEYIGNTLSMKGFRNVVKQFLKNERSRLKKIYLAGNDTCPVQVHENQWDKLKAYWKLSDQVKKAATMTATRHQVKNVSKGGRQGKAGREAAVIRNKGSSPGLTEIAEGLQASQADETSRALSSIANSEFASFKARQDRVESQMEEVLASNKRTADALEALQATLMEYLRKDRSTIMTTTLKPNTLVAGPSTDIVGEDNADNDPYKFGHIFEIQNQLPQKAHSKKDQPAPSHATLQPQPSIEKHGSSRNLEIEGNLKLSIKLPSPNLEHKSELMKKDNTTREAAKVKSVNTSKDFEGGRIEPHVIQKSDSTVHADGNVKEFAPSPKRRKKSLKSTTQKREIDKVLSDNQRGDIQKTHKFLLGQQVSLVSPKIPK